LWPSSTPCKDFKRDLKALRRTPRYVVAPAADVAVDEVRFLFGSSIFVPDENDELLAHLRLLGAGGCATGDPRLGNLQ